MIIFVFRNWFLSVCLCVWEQCGQQKASKQRKIDRQWKEHCCLSIHLRCTWKSSTMTAHPSATGVLLSLLEQNQKPALSIRHPFSGLHSLSLVILSACFAEFSGFLCVGVAVLVCLMNASCFDKWQKFCGNKAKEKVPGQRMKANTAEFKKWQRTTSMKMYDEQLCTRRRERVWARWGSTAAVDLIPS